jgi:hypothetical protein
MVKNIFSELRGLEIVIILYLIKTSHDKREKETARHLNTVSRSKLDFVHFNYFFMEM